MEHLKNDKWSHGVVNDAMIKFNVHCNTIYHLWYQAKMSTINNNEIFCLNSQKYCKCE